MIPLASLVLIFTAVSFALYWPALHGDFVFDDGGGIEQAPEIMAGNILGERRATRAITRMSYAANVRIFGKSPLSFHATNIVLHAIVAVVVFALSERLGLSWNAAVLTAVIFLVHPIATSAVANISGRSSLLSTLFMLVSILLALSSYWWLAPITILAAVRSKEDAAITPLTIGALLFAQGQWWPLGVLTWAIVLALMVGRNWLRHLWVSSYDVELVKAGHPAVLPYCSYLPAFITESVVRSVGWFYGLGHHPDKDMTEVSWEREGLAAAIFSILVSIALTAREPQLWYASIFLVASPWLVYAVRSMPDMFEHRMYFSSIGFALTWSFLLSHLPWPVTVGACCWFVVRTIRLAGYWKTDLSLWGWAERCGSTRARVALNLGVAHMKRNDDDLAIECFYRALQREPTAVTAWLNMGIVAKRIGEYETALRCFRKAIHHGPLMYGAWFCLAEQYLQIGRTARAATCYRRTVRLNPEMDLAWHQLGLIQADWGSYNAARDSFEKAAALKPSDLHYRTNLGLIHQHLGEMDEAKACFDGVPASMLLL